MVDIDIQTCEACGGAVRIVAAIEDPAVIQKILDHLDRQGAHAIISGDMLHSPYQMARPEVGVIFDSDGEQARRTRRAFFGRYADRDILLLGTHFATPVAGHIVSHGESWRFKPLEG